MGNLGVDTGAPATTKSDSVDAGGDVEMKPRSKKIGVLRTIGKRKHKSAAERSRDKALLRAAKARGPAVEETARRLLNMRKKAKYRPNGKERTRDKKIRVKREQRERRG